MIEGIDIINYQSHVNTSIDFHEATTAITGLSMEGKTAILRAFEHLRTNRPLGVKRIHRYTDEPMEIVIRVDGHRVGFKKGIKAIDSEGTKSLYYIIYPNKKRRDFKTIGSGPPPKEVTDILNISDISIQNQLDAYLLITSTGGEIAKIINKITGLDEGEEWIKNITIAINNITNRKSILESNVKELESDIKKYDGIEEFKKIASSLKAIQNDIEKKTEAKAEIILLYSSIQGAEQSIKIVNRLKKEINPYIVKIKNIEDDLTYLRETEQIIRTYLTNYNAAKEAKKELSKAKDSYARELVKIGKCFVCGEKITDFDKIRKRL